MSSYLDQIEALRQGIETRFGMKFVLGIQEFDRPEYPFFAYNFTSINRVQNIVSDVIDVNQISRTQNEQHEITLSITALSKDEFESVQNADNLKKWLSNEGHSYLYSKNIVVVQCGALIQRDIFMAVDYERHFTFDCRLRVRNEQTFMIPLIEIVEIPEGVII